jgi:muramoyltetrapeptide carboxypeptidase LdcA involved in peptidoglycan recycling
MEFVTPPALDAGDRVAVVAPSSGGARSAPHVLSLALDRLRDRFDLDPVVHPTARQGDEFLAAHPRARAAAVHEAFRDPDIRAVFATIGGDDQLRVLRHLDPAVLREHPTRFFGMSDNTNLGLYLWREGVVSYNGGQLLNQVGTPGRLPAFSERYLRRALFEPSLGDLEAAPRWTDDTVDWSEPDYAETTPEYEPAPGWTWAGGETPVAGRVWGGCLAIVDWHLASDRYLPDPERLDGAVLAVETSEELPSAPEVRRTLMCMGERGLLGRFDGEDGPGRATASSAPARRPASATAASNARRYSANCRGTTPTRRSSSTSTSGTRTRRSRCRSATGSTSTRRPGRYGSANGRVRGRTAHRRRGAASPRASRGQPGSPDGRRP